MAEQLWPEDGLSDEGVMARVREALDGIIDHRDPGYPLILSFPMTRPLDIAVRAFAEVLPRQANNIITTTNSEGEPEWRGTRELERETVYMAAELLGMDDPVANADGYITPGGTEANLEGLWIGRKRLIAAGCRRIAILTSSEAHYSIMKGADLIGIGRGSLESAELPDGYVRVRYQRHITGLALCGILPDGSLDLASFASQLQSLLSDGFYGIIVVANAGTSHIGAVDDLPGMLSVLSNARQDCPELHWHIHVDAAFGGLVLPFLDTAPLHWTFANPAVDSVTLDPHKFGMAPAGAGMFLCRKGQMDSVCSMISYLHEGRDDTISGSRSGAAAVACWAAFHSMGRSGYRRLATEMMELKRELLAGLALFPQLEVIDSPQNTFGLCIADNVDAATRSRLRALFADTKRYVLRYSHLPVRADGDWQICRPVYKVLVMPHLNSAKVAMFLRDIKTCLSAT